MSKSTFSSTLSAVVAAAALSACGGGGGTINGSEDASATPAPAAATAPSTATAPIESKLTLSVATPAGNNTTIDLATATTKGNNARAADSFSAVPYCEVFWENAKGANGKTYAVQVYFRQSDKAPLHVSVYEPGYSVYSNDSGNPITGVTLDTAARTLTFTSKALAGGTGELGTLDGSVGFPANPTTADCGA